MIKRSLLSISLLFAVVSVDASVPASATEPLKQSSMPSQAPAKIDFASELVDDAFKKTEQPSRLTALSDKLKDLPALLQKNLVQGYNKSIGRVYNPDALQNRNSVKAAVFVGASAAIIYACYLVWKKYFASKQEENEEEELTRAFCVAARNARKNN